MKRIKSTCSTRSTCFPENVFSRVTHIADAHYFKKV